MNIHRDAHVEQAGRNVGRVTHVIVDPRTREVTDLVIRQGGSEWQVPISAVDVLAGDHITLRGDLQLAQAGRPFRRDEYQSVDHDTARDQSEWHAAHGGMPLLNADDDAVHVGETAQTALRTQQPAAEPAFADSAQQDHYHLQLKEEQLRVSTTPEEQGAVRVGKRVVERTETVEVPVREEWLIIESKAGSGRVMVGDRELAPGETIELPLLRERVVVNKETVISDDVTIRKQVVEHTEPVQATVRKEQLVVDDPIHAVAAGSYTGAAASPTNTSGAPEFTPAPEFQDRGDPDGFRLQMEAERLRVAEEQAHAGTVPVGPQVSDRAYQVMTSDGDASPMIGVPVVTVDGEVLGTVGEVHGDSFKVSAPMARDYWLSISDITGTAPGGDLVVGVRADELEGLKRRAE